MYGLVLNYYWDFKRGINEIPRAKPWFWYPVAFPTTTPYIDVFFSGNHIYRYCLDIFHSPVYDIMAIPIKMARGMGVLFSKKCDFPLENQDF